MKWCLTPTTLITGVVFLKSKPVEVHTQIFESLRMNILCCMFSSFKCKNVVDKTFRYYSDRQNRKCKSREVSCIEYLLCKETVLLTCSSVCFISIIKSAPYNNCQYYSGCEALELQMFLSVCFHLDQPYAVTVRNSFSDQRVLQILKSHIYLLRKSNITCFLQLLFHNSEWCLKDVSWNDFLKHVYF